MGSRSCVCAHAFDAVSAIDLQEHAHATANAFHRCDGDGTFMICSSLASLMSNTYKFMSSARQ